MFHPIFDRCSEYRRHGLNQELLWLFVSLWFSVHPNSKNVLAWLQKQVSIKMKSKANSVWKFSVKINRRPLIVLLSITLRHFYFNVSINDLCFVFFSQRTCLTSFCPCWTFTRSLCGTTNTASRCWQTVSRTETSTSCWNNMSPTLPVRGACWKRSSPIPCSRCCTFFTSNTEILSRSQSLSNQFWRLSVFTQ